MFIEEVLFNKFTLNMGLFYYWVRHKLTGKALYRFTTIIGDISHYRWLKSDEEAKAIKDYYYIYRVHPNPESIKPDRKHRIFVGTTLYEALQKEIKKWHK